MRPWRGNVQGLRRILTDYAGLTIVLLALAGVFGLATENFLTVRTLRTIANQVPDAIVIAAGMTFVLIIGGIDLSVGSVLALSSAVLGVCLVKWNWALPAALGACLLTGLLCGLVNGLVVIGWSLPSFIVTLGMLEIARGAAYLVTRSQTQYIGDRISALSEGTMLGLTLPFYTAIAIVIIGQSALSCTVFGRHMFAIGANEESARLSGIRAKRVKVTVFALSGVMASIGAVILTSRLGAADPNAGIGYELAAIAAVVIGGTSLMGGRGSAVSSLLGVLIISVLGYGLGQIGAQEPTKRLVTGCVIVVAVVIDYYRHRLMRPRCPSK